MFERFQSHTIIYREFKRMERQIAPFENQPNSCECTHTIVRTLKDDQPLRLLLNLLFYHFNRSELTYKSQCIKLQDVIAECNQLNMNAPKLDINNNVFLGEILQMVSY